MIIRTFSAVGCSLQTRYKYSFFLKHLKRGPISFTEILSQSGVKNRIVRNGNFTKSSSNFDDRVLSPQHVFLNCFNRMRNITTEIITKIKLYFSLYDGQLINQMDYGQLDEKCI